MQTQVTLKELKLPKMLAELAHSNQFLKIFSVSCLGLNLLSLILVFVLATRSPLVLSFNQNAQVMDQSSMPRPEVEVQVAAKHYLELRYQWTPENVQQKLELAKSMIQSSAMRAYMGAAQNVIHFSLEKQVSQRVYGNSFAVDMDKRIVTISGDRITAIQSLKAAGNLNLELAFELGPRTRDNPWGVYVTKEKENN